MTIFTKEDFRNLIRAVSMIQAGLTIICILTATPNSLLTIIGHAVWAVLVTIVCTCCGKHLVTENDE